MTLSTHVLDSTLGKPAAGVPVRLEVAAGGQATGGGGTATGGAAGGGATGGDAAVAGGGTVASGHTDQDGRMTGMPTAVAGTYRLVFEVAGEFYPEVVITFRVTDPDAHYHVPLLLSPYAYSTYRGS